ncbi:MAG: oligosaccharide reducing-end xylanase [Verrucomicrobiota bacterium]|nr:oligosaccharide reducing-end xylanase [Verrucomicrobiota bacterium]
MKLFRFLPFLVGLAVTACAVPAQPPFTAAPPPRAAPNLFATLLGKSAAELDAKLDVAWQHFFAGDERSQRLYYPVGDDLAYIADIGSNDVRSEGLSYGMMIAVQLDKKAEFDRLWRWANKYMRHASGPRAGYFAWQCKFDGTIIDPGSASDGEAWFAMTLFFASHRWGDGEGLLNYGAEARRLLRDMRHKPATGGITPIFHRDEKQIVFAPTDFAYRFTDPSYHVPAFYELWARWDTDPADRAFWSEAAATSRAYFKKTAHPQTGLMPEYSQFDGTPYTGLEFGPGKNDFRFDAWRTLANVALDHAWWRADPWQVEQSNRVLRFLGRHLPAVPNQFSLAGQPLSSDTSVGLTAMAAVAGHAADPKLAQPFVRQLWDAPLPEGRWRYYNGLLYCLGLLQAGGRLHFHLPLSPQP